MTIENIGNEIRITASEGKMLSDGGEPIGKVLWVGEGREPTDFYEVDEPEIATRVD